MASLALNLAVGLVTNTLLGLLSPKEGSRIMDLSAPKSSYGQAIPEIVGNCLVGGNMIWAQPKREGRRKGKEGGKGTGGKATIYSYTADFAIALCKGPIVGVSRIWLNDKIVYDYTYDQTALYPTQNNPPTNPPNGSKYTVGTKPTGLWTGHEFEVAEWQSGRWFFYPAGATSRQASNRFARYIRIYNGTDTQNPDPLIQAKEGVGRTPAFRGLAYIVFEGLPLTDSPGGLYDFGGNFPRVKAEVIRKGYRHPSDGYFVREETDLSEALAFLAMQGGLEASEIDTDCISGSLWGYAITSQKAVRDCIADLASLFHFDLYDGAKLKFLPPERTTAATIQEVELAAHEGNSERPNNYTHSIAETVSLPYEVALVYFSRERDYQEEMVYGRKVTAKILNKNSTQISIVLSKPQAQKGVDIAVHLAWIRRHVYKFSLAAKYARLQAGDRISVVLDFGTEDLVISKLDLGANLLINIEAYRYTSLTDYGGYLPTAGEIISSPSTITYLGNTLFWLLDIPLLQDSDTDYGLYVAMRGSVPAWRSGAVYSSSDNGANYNLARQAYYPTIMGVVTTALGGWSSNNLDTLNTITVELENGELAAPSGAFLLGNEILSANTVTLVDVRTYQLSNLTRGLRGTDWAIYGHVNNERFYLLSTVQRINGNRGELYQSRLYKGVTSGQALEDVNPVGFIYNGNDLKPYPVANVGAYKTSGNIVVVWLRRDRHDADTPINVAPKLSEFDERYEIDVYNGASVIRTIRTSVPQVTYTIAQQITDFGAEINQISCIIYQISEIVGRGYPKSFASGSLGTTPPTMPVITPTTSNLASNALQKDQNLADVPNKALARQNLEITTWLDISIRTSNYTAQNSERIPCNTTGGSFTITLPATGNLWVYDVIGNSTTTGFGANALFLAAPVGSTIMGQNIFTVAIGGSGLILGKVGTDWRIMNQYGTSAGSGSSGFPNPMTTLGDLIVGGDAGTPTRFSPNNSGVIKYLAQGANALPWTLADITTALWFDGDDLGSMITSDGKVSRWNDKSGNGFYAIQNNGLNQLGLTTINGRNCLNCNNNQWLVTTGDFTFQSYAIVFRPSNAINSYDVYLSMRSSLSSITPNSITNISLVFGHWNDTLNMFDNSASKTFFNGVEVPLSSQTTPFPDSKFFFLANTSKPNIAYSEYNISSGTGTKYLLIGGDTALASRFVTGQICEIAFFPTILTTAEQQQVTGYFAHKWGNTNELANDHPYKFNPPTKAGSIITTEWKEIPSATVTTTVKTTNYTAADKEKIPCNTSGGSFTITLPNYGTVTVFDVAATNSGNGFGTNPLTVSGTSGDTIMGNNSLILNVGGTSIELEKIGSDWRIISKFTL